MPTETAKAAEPIPFGSPIRVTDAGIRACRREDMQGIAKRPWKRGYGENQTHYARGETVIYQTDGEVLGLIGNDATWVDLIGGRIVT